MVVFLLLKCILAYKKCQLEETLAGCRAFYEADTRLQRVISLIGRSLLCQLWQVVAQPPASCSLQSTSLSLWARTWVLWPLPLSLTFFSPAFTNNNASSAAFTTLLPEFLRSIISFSWRNKINGKQANPACIMLKCSVFHVLRHFL